MKAWLFFFVFAIAIAILGNSKLVAGQNDQHAGRKLATDNIIPGFISIDCGSDEDYTNKQTGIPYKSDKQMIDTGIAKTVLREYSTGTFRSLKNLRSFPEGTRNCYTLRPEQGKNKTYMVRARFWYGNYDGRNAAPSFELYLGTNWWDTVILSSDHNKDYEIMHVPSTDYIDVCLVNTGFGVPFISTLELRLLNNSIYQIDDGGALETIRRYDVGRNNAELALRYPIDPYDRYWTPLLDDNWIPIATDLTNYSTQANDSAYKLPAEVLRTAAKTGNASIPLNISWSNLVSHSKYKVYFHFVEIEKLGAGQQRELTIDLNGQRSNLTESVKLDYLKPLITIVQDGPTSTSESHFSINAAEGTTLPPILNAVEIFVLKELPIKPTALDDVEAIMEIKKRYTVTKNWQGDPCVPSEYSWEGLNCSNDDNPPRIISLNLSSSKLAGEIATSFSNLTALQSLDLSYNDLTGPFPEALAQLSYLNTLDLRGNKLTGPVPEALVQKSRDGKFVLRVGNNLDLCQSASCKRKKKNEFVIPVVASSIAVLILLLIVSALALYRRKRQGGIVVKSDIKSKNRWYSYYEVESITNNFKTMIGRGGFGSVYLGTLKDDSQVAVKLLSPSSKQGYKEFQAEAQLLMIVHHRNLVSLVGYCDEGENKALIYEYMANGNLQQQLSVTNTFVLKWNQRLHIAVDAAHGLEYLHNGCKPSIIHRDVKTSNILLNDHMQAKLADFGLSRAFANESDSHVSTDHLAGTIGYLDPQCQASGIFNKKSDVYSFGIVLIELITGKPAIIRGPVEDTHILQWINPLIEQGDIQNIVDPRLEGEFNTNSTWRAMEIAMSCIKPAIQRTDMSSVLAELKECLAEETDRFQTIPSRHELEIAPHAR